MRRTDREMTREFALMVVDKSEYASMAVNPDGTPYIVTISMARVGEDIFFHCAPVGHKIDNLRANARVCLSCVSGTNVLPEQITTEYESAIIFGEASEVTEPTERMNGMRAIMQKYSSVIMDKFDNIMQATGKPERMSVWKIHINSITGKCNDKSGKYEQYKMHKQN